MTSSPTFERIVAGLGLARRSRQDQAVNLAASAVALDDVAVIQAPTGVGKSFVAIATAADYGQRGKPGIIGTTTNGLAAQYLRDCRATAPYGGFTYTRVMGAAHYACASSEAAREDQVPDRDDLIEIEPGIDNRDEIIAARSAWLDAFDRGGDRASAWELRELDLDESYRCPGYPDCSGASLGGCGSKRARARATQVDVVVTNYHLIAYAHRLRDRLPTRLLPEPAVVICDEAHRLPGTIAEIDGGRLTPMTGSRAYAGHTDLVAAAHDLIASSLDLAQWGSSAYDTEAEVSVDEEALSRFAKAYRALPPAIREQLEQQESDEPGDLAPGDVTTLLRRLAVSGRGGAWRAWTTREHACGGKCTPGHTWRYSGRITLGRVDAAAHVVPEIVPSGVLLSGTLGGTFPARVGLPDSAFHDLGQEFDWSRVRGTVSGVDGRKTGDWKTEVLPRIHARAAELAYGIAGHRGALVLSNAHEDLRTIERHLGPRLPGRRLFVQPREGGSLAASEVKADYIAHVSAGGFGVLIGTESYATGVDLPGELCTFVAWWTCHRGVVSYFDGQVAAHYLRAGNYIDELFRSRFAQGLGRLLRRPTDTGEVMVCDSRFIDHIRDAVTPIDRHLCDIDWCVASEQVAA